MQKIIQRAANILDRSPDYFKSDVRLYELNRRFLWFVVFRFIVTAALLFAAFTKDILFMHISVSRVAFLVMAGLLLLANGLYWLHYRKAVSETEFSRYFRKVSLNVQIQIVFDFLILGYLTYRCGGIESPLVYFFLFHNVISCLFFKKVTSFIYMVLSVAIIFLISLGPFLGLLPSHHFIFPAESAIFYNRIMYAYQLAGVVAVYSIVWFVASSITDSLKRHEARLQDKIDELVTMDKEKTRYMLVTTHELKAPFSSIQSYVNVLLGGYAGEISEKVHEIMWKIKVRCETLMRMITEMIQLANISSMKERKEEVVMKRLDLVRVIGSVVRRFTEAAKAKNVTIAWPEEKFCELEANSEQLDILFNNILSNAVNYCYPDSEIRVEIKDSEDLITVGVTDKGIGIKKEHLEKIFLEYFRTEQAVLINRNSTGLGLSISRQIMMIHRGKIWVESEENVETTVFMEFPKIKEE